METSVKMAFFSMAIITSQLMAAVRGQTTDTTVTTDPATTTSLCCSYKTVIGGIWEDYDGYPDSTVIGNANVYVLDSGSDYFTKPKDYCDDGCIYTELGTDVQYCFMSLQTPYVSPSTCTGSDSVLGALGDAAGNAVDEIEDQTNPDDLDDAFDDFCLDPENAEICLERFRRVKRESGNSEDDLSTTPMPHNSTRESMLKRLTDKVIAYQLPTTSIINIVNAIIKNGYIADGLVAKALEYRDEMVVEDANSLEGPTEKDKQDNIMRFNKILNLINRSIPNFF